MVECHASDLTVWVQFPVPAPCYKIYNHPSQNISCRNSTSRNKFREGKFF